MVRAHQEQPLLETAPVAGAGLELTPAQQAFVDRLDTLRDSSYAALPNFAAELPHDGRLPGHAPISDQLDGVHLAAEVVGPYRQAGEMAPNHFSFDLDPLSSLGRTDSWRKVFFGWLGLQSRSGAVEQRIRVAVKPFPMQDANKAVQECGMFQYAADLGLATLQLVGVVVDRQTDPSVLYVLTEVRDELMPLGSHDWTNLQPEEVDTRVTPALDTLLQAHQLLLFHGDPDFRNIVEGDKQGSVSFVDLESAVSLRDALADLSEDQEVPIRLFQALSRDLSEIQESFKRYIFPNLPQDLQPQTDAERFEYVWAHFFRRYRDRLRDSESPHRLWLERAFEAVMARKREDAGLPPEDKADDTAGRQLAPV